MIEPISWSILPRKGEYYVLDHYAPGLVNHGDEFSQKSLAPHPGAVLCSGHTHIYVLKKENGFIFLNPGSISFPKNGNPPTYAFFDGKTFEIRSFDDDQVVASLPLSH
jgi:Predicted phosphoesterase